MMRRFTLLCIAALLLAATSACAKKKPRTGAHARGRFK